MKSWFVLEGIVFFVAVVSFRCFFFVFAKLAGDEMNGNKLFRANKNFVRETFDSMRGSGVCKGPKYKAK